ncbi:hypothetical protein QVD17_20788 [Tagetes erecta]|uniref:Uncharacterized protein n=1 Tax=Tagetes erecta TaxID=13708 RepID=A0AAD8KQG4_TARER|nr:hypothetical protein QVD17_20788 [Tagetes erecta]
MLYSFSFVVGVYVENSLVCHKQEVFICALTSLLMDTGNKLAVGLTISDIFSSVPNLKSSDLTTLNKSAYR